MDISVIKEQLGNFKDFVGAVNKLIENFPAALTHFGGVVTGEIKPFGETGAYNDSVDAYTKMVKDARSK